MSNRDFPDRVTVSVHYASTPALLMLPSPPPPEDSNSMEEDSSEACSSASTTSSGRRRDFMSSSGSSQVSSSNYSSCSPRLTYRDCRPNSYRNPPGTATLNKSQLRQIHRPKSLYHLLESVQNEAALEERQQQQQQSMLPKAKEDSLVVTDADLRAIDTCYRGNKTRVFVCTALANLYTSGQQQEWVLFYTGIPVLVLDTGCTRSRTKRQIQFLLVEKGTCFALYRDVVDNLSGYSCQDDVFHVMHVSTDHQKRIGLSFDEAEAARKFHACLDMLTSDPANIALKGPGNARKQRKMAEQEERIQRERHSKYRRPSKAEISLPCGFQHVVSVNHTDKYFSLQAYVNRWNRLKTKEEEERREDSLSGQMARLSVFSSSCSEINV